MDVIIIPKNLIKNDDLVIIPRKDYEALLKKSKNFSFKNKEQITE